jgi:Holliday junction resolvasome RuvABC endonuclease subunit
MRVIGIDPGKNGGIAVIGQSGRVTTYCLARMTPLEVFEALNSEGPAVAVMEKVHSSPQMGVRSAFSFGESYGSLRMAAIAAKCRVVTVVPRQWQATLGLKSVGAKMGSVENKRRNKALAQELYPGVRVTHAIADALLLAEYGRRVERRASRVDIVG